MTGNSAWSICVSALLALLLAACGPRVAAGVSPWTGETTTDPLTDAAVATAVTQVWDSTGSYFVEVTLTCTSADEGAAFQAAAVFFDEQSAGAPLLILGHGGPQDVATLRVGDLEAVTLGLGRVSTRYTNELFLLSAATGNQRGGEPLFYSIMSQLPEADRLLIRPTLTTGEPVFTINFSNEPVLQNVFSNCAPVFQQFAQMAREEQARRDVQQEQAELYADRTPATEAPEPVPPRREEFQQRAAAAEAECLRTYGVTQDPVDAARRSMCAETGASWRRQYVNEAHNYAFRVRTMHSARFGHDRWVAEGRAAAPCLQEYEAASAAARTSEAADAAAQAAVDCYVAAGNPPPVP